MSDLSDLSARFSPEAVAAKPEPLTLAEWESVLACCPHALAKRVISWATDVERNAELRWAATVGETRQARDLEVAKIERAGGALKRLTFLCRDVGEREADGPETEAMALALVEAMEALGVS